MELKFEAKRAVQNKKFQGKYDNCKKKKNAIQKSKLIMVRKVRGMGPEIDKLMSSLDYF